MAKHSSVEAIDCLEISPAVVEAARLFGDIHGHIQENRKIRIIEDDGVNYLRRTSWQYDAIVSDAKSRHPHAGNSVFHSADYYTLCRDHLGKRGLFLQWVPVDMPPHELRTILRTFFAVFPTAHVWVDPPASAFLVGGKQALRVDLDGAAVAWDTGHLRISAATAGGHLRCHQHASR